MAEGGDSVDSGRKSGGSLRNKMPENSLLYLGSEEVGPLLCREHGQEFKHFCTDHMTEICITCEIMEHKNCEIIIGIKEAAENIYSKIHGEKITQSVKNLGERFQYFKLVIEDLKSKIPNKRKAAVDKIEQARKKSDDSLDKPQANAIDEIDRNLKEYKDTLEKNYDVCTASLTSLCTSSYGFERTMSVGNKVDKFIAINRATKQTKQYCDVLLNLRREIREMNVKVESNKEFSDILSLGTLTVEDSKVTDVFTDLTLLYTGEMKLKFEGNLFPTSYDLLPDGRKLILDINNDKIQVYDKRNTFVTETVLPIEEDDMCLSIVITWNTEILVSTDHGRVFNVKIGDELTVSEIQSNYRIVTMTKYGEDFLCLMLDGRNRVLCIIDKEMSKIKKTILKDDGTLFSKPAFLGVSADKNTVYVLDPAKGCYGITLDGKVVFHYQNPEAKSYLGLVVDEDKVFIGVLVGHKFQVEKLELSGKRQCVCTIVGNAYPSKLVENELVLFKGPSISFYCLVK